VKHDPHVTLERVDVEAVRPLRREVLRRGQPPEASIYPHDDDPATVHVGAFTPERTLVGVATLLPPENRHAGQPPYRTPGARFRGMGVDPAWQKKGVGARLLAEMRRLARERGARELWANARVSAVTFYERHGLRVVSTPFDLPALGEHLVVAEPL
jgi:GNAT superfamily N-acetyltransferase